MTTKIKLLLIWISLCFCDCLLTAAEPITVDELLTRVDQNEQTYTTLRIRFTQGISMQYSKEAQTMEGVAYFIKPDKIRIEHKKPQEEIFITDGKKAWFYSPALKQVMITSWNDLVKGGKAGNGSLPKGLFDFTNSVRRLKESCFIDLKSEDSNYYVLNVTPKNGSDYSINLWISKQDYFPSKTSLITANATISTTVIAAEKNITLNKGLFKFKKPKDVAVFDMPF